MIQEIREGVAALDLADLLHCRTDLPSLHMALSKAGVGDARGQLPVVLIVNCGGVAGEARDVSSAGCGDAIASEPLFRAVARAVRDKLARQRRANTSGDEPAWLIGVREEHVQWYQVSVAEAPELAEAVGIVADGGGTEVYSEYVRTRDRSTWTAEGPDGKLYDQLDVSPIPGTRD